MAQKLVYDRPLFYAVLGLILLGLLAVHSASMAMAHRPVLGMHPLFLKQLMAASIGFLAMLGAMHLDLRWLRGRPGVYALLLGVAGLLVATVAFAPELNQTRRWLRIGPLSLQTSELAKLALVPYVAYQIAEKRARINTAAFLVPVATVSGLLLVPILIGRDLGTAILLLTPACALLFLAGLAWRLMAIAGASVGALMAAMIWIEPYRWARLTAFTRPDADPSGDGYQTLQSLITVGSGGLFGRGLGNSVQKLNFLPSPHADFVFAISAEELGLLGALVIVGLFFVVLWRGAYAGRRAPDDFTRYLAWGFTAALVGQALVHVSVVLGLLPATGVPLPFISHGGTSLLVSMVMAGVILNVSQHA